jgi:hypothetical protein
LCANWQKKKPPRAREEKKQPDNTKPMARACGQLTPIDSQTIDWVVARDVDNVLGIRERDVRAALDAIFTDFSDAAQTTVKKWMKSTPWTRAGLTEVLAPRLDDLPVEALLAQFSDGWLQSHSFQLHARERDILVQHAMRHLLESLTSDFLGGVLTASRVAQRSEELSTWCHLLGTLTNDLVCYAAFLENSVPEMLFTVQGDQILPMALVGDMAKRSHAIAGSVEVALPIAARRLVRVSPPDPDSSWSWMFPTNQMADGLAVVADEPLRTALLDFVDSRVKPESYKTLMKSGSNPIKLHRRLHNKRLREGSLDTTYRLCHELIRCYKENPAFDARPRVAIVNAIMEETQDAMLVADHKAGDFRPAQRVIGNWMNALGVPNTKEVHELLAMVPAMRQDLHLATVVALTADSNKRARRIEEKLEAVARDAASAKQLAASRHNELTAQIHALTKQLQAANPIANEDAHEGTPGEDAPAEEAPYIEPEHDPMVLRDFGGIFLFGPQAGRLSSVAIREACATFATANPTSRLRELNQKQRGKVLRQLGASSGMVGATRGWKQIGLQTI